MTQGEEEWRLQDLTNVQARVPKILKRAYLDLTDMPQAASISRNSHLKPYA